MKKNTKTETMTTPSRLNSIIKTARDIMRKDKGLNGDLDRLPQLTWMMFLKFLDDMEKIHEAESKLENKEYLPLIDEPYRWRDWASKPEGITGDELLFFINNEDTLRPDGSKGKGLLPYLRKLEGSNGRNSRNVISSVFRGVNNRMISGYLLRDVLNKVNEINFSSSEEIHILSRLYESLLKELRDAAGDSGEFYTPRPVVKFMVEMINPKLGETILDPAAGTGGFLIESFIHLENQCKTTENYNNLQKNTLFGIEAKSLPYMLCQMNMLLHQIEYPNIDPLNALRTPLREIGDNERVDIVLTNPPFGGEEERGILSNFPDDKQTSETALLFLQLIMRKLRRNVDGQIGGRCAVILPKGNPLSAEGTPQRVRQELLSNFNLHTVVKLPKGVFSPYTSIATNILFFDNNGSTKEIWYYEIPKREGKGYSKSRPIKFEEFKECMDWWNDRKENGKAWKVTIQHIVDNKHNLDQLNPLMMKSVEFEPPQKLLEDMIIKIQNVASNFNQLNSILNNQ